MALVVLEGMRFHAFHGVHPEEQVLGTAYVVNVEVQTGIAEAAKTDSIEQATVNYETVFQICMAEMAQPRKLLETVVTNIIKRMKRQFPQMKGIKVQVRKLNPPISTRMRAMKNTADYQPIGGSAEAAWVQDEGNFESKCPRCKTSFLCYADETCWCKELNNLHPATQETLKRQFGTTCLCPKCLKLYAG
ncbi:MAG: dihydroneopterin aldolase [Saprospiraceae bacterium]|nr:dihydroneopterin aldolase [Saprospiraceae bacterium]